MSGTEFIIAAIICVLFGCTCYWIGYGYGKEQGAREGRKQQKEAYAKSLDAYQQSFRELQQRVDYQNSAIDAMKQDQRTGPRVLTAGQIIHLARHQGKEC